MTKRWRALAMFVVPALLAIGGCFQAPNALDITANPTEGPAPLVVSFSPVYSGAASGYEWAFGDGTASSETSPTHTYTHAGTYAVSLTVFPTQGSSIKVTKPNFVRVIGDVSPLVFWNERGAGEINAGDRSGSDRETIVDGLISPEDLAVSESRVFWTDYGTGRIESIGVDDTHRTLIASGQTYATGIAVDSSRGKVYWSCLPSGPNIEPPVDGSIRRANLDGSDVETLRTFSPDEPFAWQIAIDPVARRLYWISLSWDALDAGACEGRIITASLDATHLTTVVSGICEPTDLCVDSSTSESAQYVYWTSEDPGTLSRARVTGGGIEQLVSGIPEAESVAVDPDEGRMYWTAGTLLQSARLDGSDVETLFSGLALPEGIAIDR